MNEAFWRRLCWTVVALLLAWLIASNPSWHRHSHWSVSDELILEHSR
jgi:hypothetical protein